MPFNAEVREKALIASARYCCVCHRSVGRNIEVHHLIPEASGGSNEFDNAISLCFDCHADAGHYNPEHPRGTKFSPKELEAHRDAWYERVREGPLDIAAPNLVHCRYLVCKSFDLIREVSAANLRSVQLSDPLLVETLANSFLRRLVNSHPVNHRDEAVSGAEFDSLDDYYQTHPNVIPQEGVGHLAYFEAARTPSSEEMAEGLFPRDPISQILFEGGVPLDDIAYALAYTEQCGGQSPVQEVFHSRPVWGLYLAVTNLDQRPVTLESMEYRKDIPTGLGYRPLWPKQSQKDATQPLPQAPLPPDATALLPLASLLGPLWPDRFDEIWTESISLGGGRVQHLSHGDMHAVVPATSLIGPAMWPRAIRGRRNGYSFIQDIHDFDIENVYVQSRDWEIGCCPHLFLDFHSKGLSYGGELFARQPGVAQEHQFLVPEGVGAVVIAELEDELTHLELVEIDGARVLTPATLRKGQVIRLRVANGVRCRIRGRYYSPGEASRRPWRRNELISDFLASQAEGSPASTSIENDKGSSAGAPSAGGIPTNSRSSIANVDE